MGCWQLELICVPVVYACYLVFQLFSHKELYEDRYQDEGGDIYRSAHYPEGRSILYKPQWLRAPGRRGSNTAIAASQSVGPMPLPMNEPVEHGYELTRVASSLRTRDVDHVGSPREASPHESEVDGFRRNSGADVEVQQDAEVSEEIEVESPRMSMPMTIGLLVVVTVLVAVTAEWLVGSINGLTSSGHIKKEWVGLILLPIVSNAAEHATAVTVSVKDKLTLSMGVAVGAGIVSRCLCRAYFLRNALLNIGVSANCPLCHPIYCGLVVDHGQATHDAVRPLGEHCSLPRRSCRSLHGL